MLISSQTDFLARAYGDEQALRRLSAYGFDAVDFGMFHYPLSEGNPLLLEQGAFEAYFLSLGQVAKELGLLIGQVHSPFPTYLADGQDDTRLLLQQRAVRATALLGCKYMVMHPAIPAYRLYDQGRQACKALNMQRYSSLIPELEKYDVQIAVENMFAFDKAKGCYCPTVCSTVEEMLDYIHSLNALSPRFVACLDVGHALITGDTPQHMALQLGQDLRVLHIQDNDGLGDWHVIPHLGSIDWPAFLQALRQIRYPGTFSLEADYSPTKLGAANADAAFRLMVSVARNLADAFEG